MSGVIQRYEPRVPSAYQEVEYIQSNGNGAYLDTGYIPTANTRIAIDFKYNGRTSDFSSIPLIGTRYNTNPSDIKFAFWVNHDNSRIAFTYGNYDSSYSQSEITDATVRNITSNILSDYYYNGTHVTGGSTAVYTDDNLSMYLFALHQHDATTYRGIKANVYSLKIYENTTLMCDFVPAYRKSDNAIGLYDTVNDVFITNIGSGTFSAGLDVNSWHDIPYTRLEAATDTLSALPVTTYNDGTNAAVAIKGNMSQSGTPTSSSPITPSETGDRTVNILPRPASAKTETVDDITFSLDSNGTLTINGSTGENAVSFYYDLANDFTFPTSKQQGGDAYLYYWNTFAVNSVIRFLYNNTQIDYWSILPVNRVISKFDNLENATVNRIKVEIPANSTITNGKISIMVTNDGEQATQFEPYGYKLSIVSGGVTTNAYLGEVQSTRNIYKWVLTGTENWNVNEGVQRYFYVAIPSAKAALSSSPRYCSHFTEEETFINPAGAALRIYDQNTAYADTTAFKAFLATQYSAGTPVTLWYILATPVTGIANEPIRKIGSYADSVSVANIPTTSGGQTFDVNTTLKPSEVDLTYHGWHEHEPLKRENGSWS